MNALLFAALEHSPVPKVVADDRMVVRYMNRASRERLEALQADIATPVDQIVGRRLDQLVQIPWSHPDEATGPHGPTCSTLVRIGEETLELWVDALVDHEGTFHGAVATWDVVTGHLTTLRRENTQLQHHADHDPLTGALNRRAFSDVYEARGGTGSGALFLIDLDHFKHHNDTYGHARGDQILVAVVDGIRRRLRREDVIARMGGDEFIVLVDRIDADDAALLAGELLRTVAASARRASYDPDQAVTVSVGVVGLHDHPDLDTALTRADAALYDAKESGRNTYRHAPAQTPPTWWPGPRRPTGL